MQGKFVKNLALLLVLNLMIKPFWILGIDRTIQNTVGAESYGFYFAVFNFSFLFNILLDLGITNFNNRNIAQNKQLLTKHLSKLLVVRLLLFFLYLVVTFSFAFVINYSQEQIRILYLLALNQFLLSFILYLRSNLSGLHLFRTDSMISVLDRSLMIVICGVLIWGNVVEHFKIQYYIYAQTAGYTITCLITFLLVVRHTQKKLLRLNWNFPFLLAIVRQSFPFALLILLMTLYSRVDSVMLERLLEDGAIYSGIYASAYRLLDATNMIAYLFAGLLLPIFARMIKQNQSVHELVRLAYTLIITAAAIIASGAFFYSEPLMEILYPIHGAETQAMFMQRIEESSRVFGLLMICFMAMSTTYIFGTLLTASGKLRSLNIIAFAGMIMNIILNFSLIPVYQATGSAVSTLFTQLLVAGFQIWIVKKVFRMKPDYAYLSRLFLFFATTVLLGWGSTHLGFSWKLNLLLFGLVCSGMALALKLISVRHIYQLLRYGEA